MIYIGVDPGVRECGVAIEFVFRSRHYEAFLVRSKERTLTDRACEMAQEISARLPCAPHELPQVSVCVEGQQFYGTERSKGDPQDLIYLAQVAGYVMGAIASSSRLAAASMPLPREWKGSVPKAVHHDRLARDYPHWVEPVARDTPESKQHHVWDAVGLLEWHKERSTK